MPKGPGKNCEREKQDRQETIRHPGNQANGRTTVLFKRQPRGQRRKCLPDVSLREETKMYRSTLPFVKGKGRICTHLFMHKVSLEAGTQGWGGVGGGWGMGWR